MNIIWAFVFTILCMPQFLYSEEDSKSSSPASVSFKTPLIVTKTTPSAPQPKKTVAVAPKQKKSPSNNSSAAPVPQTKKAETKPQQSQKQNNAPAKQNAEKQNAPQEKNNKKIKPSAPAIAVLLKDTKSPGFIAPFEKTAKMSSAISTKTSAQQTRTPIFAPKITLQNLADIEIGNASRKPIIITSLTFSYKYTMPHEKTKKPIMYTKTQKVTFSQPRAIAPLKKSSFSVRMKSSCPLEFTGIKNIQCHTHHISFDPAITDISKPIVLMYDDKGKLELYPTIA